MVNSLLRTVAWVCLVVGALVGLARLTCLRWWQLPLDDPDLAASVAPTLSPGDWLILWRATAPGFGDLVLCPDPDDAAEIVIGRIAAEGGDHLVIDPNGDMQINNSRVRSERVCKQGTFVVQNPRSGDDVELRCDIEALGGVHHKRALRPSGGLRPMPIDTEVQRGHIYLVSDNRIYPFDSRDFGSLPRESCRETIIFRLVSRLGFGDVESRLQWIQ